MWGGVGEESSLLTNDKDYLKRQRPRFLEEEETRRKRRALRPGMMVSWGNARLVSPGLRVEFVWQSFVGASTSVPVRNTCA